jgi:hypothetical protein
MLARCPFCNSANVDLDERAGTFVICDDCGCEGPFSWHGPQVAFDLWNRRPDPADGDKVLPTDHGDEGN